VTPRGAALVLAILVLLPAACDGSTPQAPPLDRPSVSPGGGGGACSQRGVDGATAIRFESRGSCLTGDLMVLYRCEGSTVPVLRIASVSGPSLYLGGSFAVPVDTVPANVRFVGVGEGTEVLISDPIEPTVSASPSAEPSPSVEGAPAPPEPEPLVYVRQGGTTERWLHLEGRRGLHDPPIVWLIGDSILDGGREEVEARLAEWALTLDAEIGRSSSSAAELASDAVEQDADAVVVELGTNDASATAFRESLTETLDQLAGVPLVIWQTAHGPPEDTTIPAVNDVIRRVVPTYPNAAIADWDAFVPDEALEIDGVHPDEGFTGLEAELVVPMLEEWHGALSREGATSCGRKVVAATS
jgi:hypothetical protein